MTSGDLCLSDLTASELAHAVRAGRVTPAAVVEHFLQRIEVIDPRVGAFEVVRRERALAEAKALSARDDLDRLPLAGIPVAIKDNTDVAGEPSRWGTPLIPAEPRPADDEVVRRLRAAGAIVLGKTRVPELSAWGTADGPFGACRNPWDLSRTAGGSSGGSAAAVAAGMAPLALGSDGLGSIRIPAAACGVVGVKPGTGVVPAGIGVSSWLGMAEHGPIATTVEDAALMLSVLADRPDLATVAPPGRRLRVAVSTRAPMAGVWVDREFAAATEEVGQILARAGHDVVPADPPYTLGVALDVVAFWCAAVSEEAERVDASRLSARTRRHASAGRLLRRLGRVRQEARDRWRARLAPFFNAFDLLLTPGLARLPIAADGWGERSWLANVYSNASYAPFPAAWNFAGYPAATIPAGLHSRALPLLSVQLVAPPGGEALILSAARLIEEARPWPRHAPIAMAQQKILATQPR